MGSDELCLSLSCWKLTENGEFVKKKKKKKNYNFRVLISTDRNWQPSNMVYAMQDVNLSLACS